MPDSCIIKNIEPGRAAPNLLDYAEATASFSWSAARRNLDGLPGGGLNMAHEAVDRHVGDGRGDLLALRWLGRDGEVRDFTYRNLALETNRFARLLQRLEVGAGDVVFSLLGRVPELYIAALVPLKPGRCSHRCSLHSVPNRYGRE